MKGRLLFLTVLVFSFISCNDNTPSVSSISVNTVMEFKDQKSFPEVSLSVFAETVSDIQRAKEISFENIETGLCWSCNDLKKVSDNSKKWAGRTAFFPPENSVIPMGKYTFTYRDSSGSEWTGEFSVKYNKDFLKYKASKFPECIKEKKAEKVALYNASGDIIFYGDRKKSWTDDEAIKKDYKDSVKRRDCYYLSDDKVLIIMPEVSLEDK